MARKIPPMKLEDVVDTLKDEEGNAVPVPQGSLPDEIFDAEEGADLITEDGEVHHVSSMKEVETILNKKPMFSEPVAAGQQQSEKDAKDEKDAFNVIKMLLAHPRVLHMKELNRPFIIISASETFFKEVYDKLRADQIRKMTWSPADQGFYEQAISYWRQKMAGDSSR